MPPMLARLQEPRPGFAGLLDRTVPAVTRAFTALAAWAWTVRNDPDQTTFFTGLTRCKQQLTLDVEEAPSGR